MGKNDCGKLLSGSAASKAKPGGSRFDAGYIAQASMIAALYVVLTYISSMLGLSSGAVQFRLSEALTVLPYLTASAVPGLFIGCLLANALTGAAIWDVVFGSLATLIGAVGTRLLRKKSVFLSPLPPVIANMLIIPPVLMFVYGLPGSYPYFLLTIGLGEAVCCGALGLPLVSALKKRFKLR